MDSLVAVLSGVVHHPRGAFIHRQDLGVVIKTRMRGTKPVALSGYHVRSQQRSETQSTTKAMPYGVLLFRSHGFSSRCASCGYTIFGYPVSDIPRTDSPTETDNHHTHGARCFHAYPVRCRQATDGCHDASFRCS